MRIFLFTLLTVLSVNLFSQNNIVFTAGVAYTNGPPTFNPGATGTRFALDTVSWNLYTNAYGITWSVVGDWLQRDTGCAAPAYIPTKFQSVFVVNECSPPELYYYNGVAWEQIGGGGSGPSLSLEVNGVPNTNQALLNLISGTNISLTDNGTGGVVIDGAAAPNTNLNFTGTVSPVDLQSSTGNGVVFEAGANITLAQSGDTLTIQSLGGSDGNGIYSDTGVVANIPDFMIRSNPGQTLSLGYVEGATGLDDYYGSFGSGRKWYGVWASPYYFTGFTGLQYLEADSSIINGAEVYQIGVSFGAARQKSWKPTISYHSIDANTDADPSIEGVRIQGSTGNFDFYSYSFPKVSPTAVSGDTSIMVWAGNGLGHSLPTFIPYKTPTGGGGGGSSTLVIRPSQLVANQNNFSPTNFDIATHVFISGDVSFRQIRGLSSTGISDGESKVFFNTGLYPVVFIVEHTSASASNRLTGPQNYVLQPGETCELIYDLTATRWRVVLSPSAIVVGKEYRIPMGSIAAGDWGDLAFTSAGGTIGTTKPTATLPGGILLGTGVSAAGGYSVRPGKNDQPFFKGGGHLIMDCIIVTPTILSDAVERYSIGAGFGVNTTTSILDGFYMFGLVYNDNLGTDWQIAVRGNAGVTYTPTGVTVNANTPYRLRVEAVPDGTEMQAWINGVYVGTVALPVFPGNSDQWARVGILKAAGTTTRIMTLVSMYAATYNSF